MTSTLLEPPPSGVSTPNGRPPIARLDVPPSPPASGWRVKPRTMVLAGLAASGLAIGGLWAGGIVGGRTTSVVDTSGGIYRVIPTLFDIAVAKDGDLRAVENIEIVSRVEGSTTITFLIEEGSFVRKGDLVVELDSSKLRLEIEDATLQLREQENQLQNARELLEIQRDANAANLEAAEVALALAELDLRQYEQGTYPQGLVDAQTAVRMADLALKTKRGEYDDSLSLRNKGFVTDAEVKKREVELIESENALARANVNLEVLTEYKHARDLADKRNALSQAQSRVERVRRENAAQFAQRDNDVQTKAQAEAVRRRRLDRLREQLEATRIYAPADGLVVYEGGRGRDSERIAEGVQVRERQVILRLPDTARMMARVAVNESQVSRLRPGMVATVRVAGYPEPLTARVSRIAPVADSGSRWWNPDLKEYPVEMPLDRTPQNMKPGVGVVAEILVDRVANVLAVPLASVYTVAGTSYVFRHAGDAARPMPVALGRMNETHVEITQGLTGGEDVLILAAGQGRTLLERSGIDIPTDDPTPPDEDQEPTDADAVASSQG